MKSVKFKLWMKSVIIDIRNKSDGHIWDTVTDTMSDEIISSVYRKINIVQTGMVLNIYNQAA